MKYNDEFERRCLSVLSLMALAMVLVVGAWLLGGTVIESLRWGNRSDAMRQWEVCQYVKARINPWEVAYRVLSDTYGPATGPKRILMRETRVYSVNSSNWRGDPDILPGHPPPEATYPPSSVAMLASTIGMLPKKAVLPTVVGINLLCLGGVVWLLGRWFSHETGVAPLASWGLVSVVLCLWPPVRAGILCGQMVLFVLLCVWMAMRRMDDAPIMAGGFLLMAFLKPSCVLLFLTIPLLRGRWQLLGTVFCLGAFLFVAACAWVREWPWVVLGQWTGLCRYLLQGSFTLQEVVNAFAWDNTFKGMLVVLGVWGAASGWCALHRKARWEHHFVLLSLANLAWTYHESYDFAFLVVPLLVFAAEIWTEAHRKHGVIGLGLCLVVGLAFCEGIYLSTAHWAQVLRWGGRLALVALWGLSAKLVAFSAKEIP